VDLPRFLRRFFETLVIRTSIGNARSEKEWLKEEISCDSGPNSAQAELSKRANYVIH
jgi:hypothetical protein